MLGGRKGEAVHRVAAIALASNEPTFSVAALSTWAAM